MENVQNKTVVYIDAANIILSAKNKVSFITDFGNDILNEKPPTST
jgi:hypothetical protein